MRELKFRAWFENVMRGRQINGELVWGTESYYDYDPIIDNNGLLDVEAGWDIQGHSNEKHVIEQYTGLKDKNGKEIYEGDIVASSYFGKDRILKVVFYEGCFCLCETRLEIPYPGFVYYFRQGSRFRPQDDYVVIGNIHENPELLEDNE